MCISYLLNLLIHWLFFFKTHVNVITHILYYDTNKQILKWARLSVACFTAIHTGYPGIMSIILKIQSPLISDHVLPFSVVQMSDKCDFCCIALFVPVFFPLCSFLYSFSAAINLYTVKGGGKHINWKLDYITLRVCLHVQEWHFPWLIYLPWLNRGFSHWSDNIMCSDSDVMLCYSHYSHKNVLMGCEQIKFIIIQRWDNRAIANSGDPKVQNFRKLHKQ